MLDKEQAGPLPEGSKPRCFGWTGGEVRYTELTGSFKDDLEVLVDLAKAPGARFAPQSQTGREFALLLGLALEKLESLASASGDGPLKLYLAKILARANSQSLQAGLSRIRVSSKLPVDAGRYRSEIVFSESFLNAVWTLSPEQQAIVVGVRLFHELGHTRRENLYGALKEEVELILKDEWLYRALNKVLGNGVRKHYPPRYEAVLRGLRQGILVPSAIRKHARQEREQALEDELRANGYIDDHRIIADHVKRADPATFVSDENILLFLNDEDNKAGITAKARLLEWMLGMRDGQVINCIVEVGYTVDLLEAEALLFHERRKSFNVDYPPVRQYVREMRDKRIEIAFRVTDPEAPGSLVASLKEMDVFKGTGLWEYLNVLGHRGTATGRESFYFLEEDKEIIRIHFGDIKRIRLPGDLESQRAARQQYALSLGLYMTYGLGTTEAENGRGMRQGWHYHPFMEQTVSLSDHTILLWAHHILPAETPTRTVNGVERVAGGIDAGRPVVELTTESGVKRKFVVYELPAKFGEMIQMPPRTFHTLKNESLLVPAVDFTTKEPVMQMIKLFMASLAGAVPEVLQGVLSLRSWGQIRQQTYGKYNTKLVYDPKTGEMAYARNAHGELEPVMHDRMDLRLNIVTVDNGKTTCEQPVSLLYGKTQPIRFFPWPRAIPMDEKEDPLAGDQHAWVLDRDVAKLKAKVTVCFDDGAEVSIDVQGGDLIVLNEKDRRIRGYTVENVSSDGFQLVYFTIDVLGRDGDPRPSWTTLEKRYFEDLLMT